MTDYFKPDCPHVGKCSSQPYKCDSCKHNKKAKEDHYEPINPKPWYPDPYRPTNPFYPDVIWCHI